LHNRKRPRSGRFGSPLAVHEGARQRLASAARQEIDAVHRASSCERAVDHLGLASFFAGQMVAEARGAGRGGNLHDIPEGLKMARRIVREKCTRGGANRWRRP
jgi:hypothetical protein